MLAQVHFCWSRSVVPLEVLAVSVLLVACQTRVMGCVGGGMMS